MTQPSPIAQAPAKEALESKTVRLVEAMKQGDFDEVASAFDARMRSALPAQDLAATWRSIEGSAGKLSAIDSVELSPKGEHTIALAKARFERARLVIRVVYGADGLVAGLFFQPDAPALSWDPPAYADPSRFSEREVSIGSSPPLPGTLTIPNGDGPFPAVVLVHGSGPNDRDETIGGAKPFKDLAWGLGSKGVAVLRYEKRSRHAPSGIVTQKEEVLDGVRDAIAHLSAQPEIDARRIVVIGHSQGGYLAPRVGLAHPDLAGIVILAGSTRPLEDSMIEQLTYLSSLQPESEALSRTLAAARELKALVTSPALKPDDTVRLPTGGAVTGAYFLDVRGYEPHRVARRLRMPLLVLQGERDYQVTMGDFEGWRSALRDRKTVKLATYPSLNHLFIAGSGTPSPSDYAAKAHVDAAVVSDIAAWIAALP